jgi:acyl carrier protein
MNDFDARFERFVREHFADTLPASGLDTVVADLRLDSLDLLDFVLDLERHFDIEIDVDIVDEDMSLAQIREVLRDMAARRP